MYIKSRQGSAALIKHDKEMEQKMYELAILKEIGDRTGYSLNIQNIVDIITGSLHQFMEYSAVSYMLLKPEKIIFKVHLEKSVSRHFLNDIQDRMLKSLSALLNKEFNKNQVEEILTGAILVDEFDQPVRSFFNIPLVIGETVVGVLTIADAKEGLYKEEETTILYKLTRQASQTVTRLQEVIETEQKKLNAMVESMNEGVVMTDKDYRIVVVNPAAKQAVRIGDKKDVSIFDFIDHLEGRFDIRGKLEESVKLDKVLSSQDVLLGDRVFQIFVSPVKSNIGLDKDQVIGGVVIFHDITKEKEIEKMKEDFISMMVHELRSPLNGIFMITQMMEKVKKVKDIKEYSRNVNLVMNSTDSMLRIVNDLLDAAKLESGKFEIHLAPADLAEMINDRVDFFSAQAKDSGLRLSAQVSQNFPKEVMLDAARIQQVLNNLISNSLKFTHEGGTVLVQAFEHVAGG
ncbi:MAG: histidine kinase dimerization/phospho-acceptor domain-containing protein, partial [Patescibacteria group bacterium]